MDAGPLQPLTVSLIQGETRWHDAGANRAYYGDLVRSVGTDSDLVILPETFLSGFTNDTQANAEDMDGESLEWMRALAAETDTVITGSLIIGAGGHCFNRMIWMRPDGSYACYDKRHLFRMAAEHERYAAGHGRLIVDLKGWRICPQVCYDLRFPVWLRNRHDPISGRLDYDLLLFVANWPRPRRVAWRTLLRARAIENLSYCAGVNRVGIDGNDIAYAGDSAVLDFLGNPLVEAGEREQVFTVTLDADALIKHRESFPAWMDADAFHLTR